ncbi:GNAT family N-acetyltransferase [Rhizobium sp. AQ_MP]|jgi:hypothetical protein|uniref:GNAT family N-acetyltransferase n=1 Tax=Rhizobium sp. AQ_MP TaxID=2761536 RepID=UPI00163A6738|nr:GNAT family N-acetyltransferase [Rhizobium sp. AQ_MP]MBC2774692.1 GNAT family N-acetyltransferase [Rhizobium sp. AQ_MP]
MIEILDYRPDQKEVWNRVNADAKNGHLLFDRGFMDYHADRFSDCSFMFLEDGKPLALLPGNVSGNTFFSHQGLTFGGFICDQRVTSMRMLAMWDLLMEELRQQSVERIVYKSLPFIYHRSPCQEDLYALFRHGARLIRRDVTTTIDYRCAGTRSKRRDRGVKKAVKAGVAFAQSTAWADFWSVLVGTLQARHGVKPTHSLEEIRLLAKCFPEQIRLYIATRDGKVLAGVVTFETGAVAHAQYIAASPEGRDVAALDGLFDFLIERYSHTHGYFDFGISNENGGWVLNEGLVTQKEEYGGSTVVHDVYEVVVTDVSSNGNPPPISGLQK